MSRTSEIYHELFDDLFNGRFDVSSSLSREYICPNGLRLVYSISAGRRTRILSIPVDAAEKDVKLPLWKGLQIEFVNIPEYGSGGQVFLSLKQAQDTEGYIFEIVAEDLRRGLEALSEGQKSFSSVYRILKKWKKFFSAGRLPVMSSAEAQGLFGEIQYLNELIDVIGTNAVNKWESGRSTHDYYIGQNAVEIKTCSTQIPYRVHINSAHQLDNNDVNGKLFLRVYALRKDHTGGTKLPALINLTRDKLSNDIPALDSFNDKILQAGYFDSAEDFYKEGYTVREEYSFAVDNGFPRIAAGDVPAGIANLEYDLSVGACMNFAVDAVEMMRNVRS